MKTRSAIGGVRSASVAASNASTITARGAISFQGMRTSINAQKHKRTKQRGTETQSAAKRPINHFVPLCVVALFLGVRRLADHVHPLLGVGVELVLLVFNPRRLQLSRRTLLL